MFTKFICQCDITAFRSIKNNWSSSKTLKSFHSFSVLQWPGLHWAAPAHEISAILCSKVVDYLIFRVIFHSRLAKSPELVNKIHLRQFWSVFKLLRELEGPKSVNKILFPDNEERMEFSLDLKRRAVRKFQFPRMIYDRSFWKSSRRRDKKKYTKEYRLISGFVDPERSIHSDLSSWDYQLWKSTSW